MTTKKATQENLMTNLKHAAIQQSCYKYFGRNKSNKTETM